MIHYLAEYYLLYIILFPKSFIVFLDFAILHAPHIYVMEGEDEFKKKLPWLSLPYGICIPEISDT